MLRFVFQTCRENWFQSRRMQLSVTRWLIQSFAMVSSWKRKLLRMMVWIYIYIYSRWVAKQINSSCDLRPTWGVPNSCSRCSGRSELTEQSSLVGLVTQLAMRLVETSPVPSLAKHICHQENNLGEEGWFMGSNLDGSIDAKFGDLAGNGEGITITDEDEPPDSMRFHQWGCCICKTTMLNQLIVLVAQLKNQMTELWLPQPQKIRLQSMVLDWLFNQVASMDF